jgi:L-aspartate semialdehyde sulfurtransferase
VKVNRSIEEINEKIKAGKAVVFTAEEVIDLVAEKGLAEATATVDVVTTGTFGPMCSSGVFLNVGHPQPRIKLNSAWLNDVPAYAGIAAVDLYLGATACLILTRPITTTRANLSTAEGTLLKTW